MVRKKLSYRSSRLIAEQESLRQQEEELRRQEALLKRRLRRLPAAVEKSRRHQNDRRAKTIYTTMARTAQLPQKGAQRGKQHPLRGVSLREKRAAKIKFIILVLILTLLLVSIWRSLPS
ncbi:MAG: hypothetical protein C5B47_03110 [Verrucomicrobia bacterium]|nr:MAG: hypothetical protein C5B47_03110 [Verrucomicrobiota bacterium]